MNLGTVLIFAATLAAAPSPAPSPPPDPCGEGGHTSVLGAINRPTVGYSPCAVKPHEALLELGYQWSLGDVRQQQVPQGFLRFGSAHDFEWDIIGPAYLGQQTPAAAYGFADAGVGAKWEIAHDGASATGIDLLLTAPTGAAAFTAGKPTETINLDYSRSLSSRLGIAATAGVVHGNGYVAALPSMVLTDQFNSRSQIYGEAFAQTKTSAGGGALFGLDGGVQYVLMPRLELDMELGRTISDSARLHYYGIGVGVRL